ILAEPQKPYYAAAVIQPQGVIMRVALASRYRTLMLVLFPVTLGLGTPVLWLRSLNWPLSIDEMGITLRHLPHPPCRRHLQNSGASPGRWPAGCEDHHCNVRTAGVPKSSRERTDVGSRRRPAGDGAKAPTNTGFTSSCRAVSASSRAFKSIL